MFNKIRQNLARRFFKAPERGRIEYRGLEAIHTVGILFVAANKEEGELVRKYLAYLRELSKKAKAIGYYPKGRVPDLTYTRMEYEFFSARETDWLCRPKHEGVTRFMEEPFDLLIDLNLQRHFPLYYVAMGSKARMKVGIRGEGSGIYDLIIDTDPSKGLKNYLRSVDQYLEMLGPAKKESLKH